VEIHLDQILVVDKMVTIIPIFQITHEVEMNIQMIQEDIVTKVVESLVDGGSISDMPDGFGNYFTRFEPENSVNQEKDLAKDLDKGTGDGDNGGSDMATNPNESPKLERPNQLDKDDTVTADKETTIKRRGGHAITYVTEAQLTRTEKLLLKLIFIRKSSPIRKKDFDGWTSKFGRHEVERKNSGCPT
jgi:hypothetical protein